MLNLDYENHNFHGNACIEIRRKHRLLRGWFSPLVAEQLVTWSALALMELCIVSS